MTIEHDQTIAALATPAGESGIAVIRFSGAETLPILSTLFRTMSGAPHAGPWEHRRLYHGIVCDGAGEAIDEAMCAVMRGPESYTGEDTAEISCHGSTLVVTRILEAAFERGARPAAPGEFTKRAFLNGKLDLIQAEAVADLIHARSELQRKVAREQLAGTLSVRINELAAEMLNLLGLVEANIDFIEEGIDTIDYDAACTLIRSHRERLGALRASSALARPFREGYRVVIAGPVNSGKSSLFNRIIGEKRAIVTDIPGTTRDVLREPIVLDGVLFILQDTAGLRGTTDRIERIGVSLAETTLGESDIVLFVVDGSEPLSSDAKSRLEALDAKRTIVVVNKTDLPERVTPELLAPVCPGARVIRASAKTGDGARDIERAFIEGIGRDGLDRIARERVVLNARLVSLLDTANERLGALEQGFGNHAPLEILALDAREVLACYETATGRRYSDDLLDTIFSRFCIGK
jgi:tRNA modification GTPase